MAKLTELHQKRSERFTVRGVVETTALQLREFVLSGDLEPGTVITEALVSSQFGIARPSAKAAIEKLIAEGVLERTAHRSARVVTLDAESIHDIYQTRRRLESSALVELAATGIAPENARIANEEIKRLRNQNPLEIIDHDIAFHLAVIDALESTRMSTLYRRIVLEVRMCMTQVQGRRLLDTDLIAHEHSAILSAITRKQADQAVQLLTVHLERAERLLAETSADERAH